MSLQVGDQVELLIERLGIYGEGVGRVEGLTLFVEGALPGERVRVELYEKRSTFARGRVMTRLTSSPQRVEPVCPLFGRCGGCQLMHLAYEGQLAMKRQRVVDALERVGKFISPIVAPCQPSPIPLAYRNKIQMPVIGGRLGLYAQGSHRLIEVERCFIHCDLGERALETIRPMLESHPDVDLVKHLLIKTALSTQQLLVVVVTRGERFPSGLAEQILTAMPEIRGVVQNINPDEGNRILGHRFRILAGEGSIDERLSGLLFKVSPASFFQVNPGQAEQLYRKVVEWAALTGKERVLDAYCGVGTLSLLLAKQALEVVGIESVPEAVRDAKENAQKNEIAHARFLCGPAEELIQSLSGIDVAVLNPPRKGCEASLLEALAALKPRRIVYVSCDPATLARDLQILASSGYHLDEVQPYDMFPQTAHVESVASLSMKS